MPQSCPLTSPCVLWHSQTHVICKDDMEGSFFLLKHNKLAEYVGKEEKKEQKEEDRKVINKKGGGHQAWWHLIQALGTQRRRMSVSSRTASAWCILSSWSAGTTERNPVTKEEGGVVPTSCCYARYLRLGQDRGLFGMVTG